MVLDQVELCDLLLKQGTLPIRICALQGDKRELQILIDIVKAT